MRGAAFPEAAVSRRGALRLAASAAGACALSALALCGCGDSDDDRQAVRDSVDAELARLTTLSAADLLGDSLAGVEKLGVSGDDFLDAFFDGCSWEVGEVAFDGEVATAGVSLRCRSLTTVLDALNEAYTAQTLEDGGHPDESSLYATAGAALLDCVHAASPESRSADVTLSKQNGSWVIDDAGHATLISVFIGS